MTKPINWIAALERAEWTRGKTTRKRRPDADERIKAVLRRIAERAAMLFAGPPASLTESSAERAARACLLDRMIHGGEKPSKTPCPVHEGKWAGCHFGWPGTKLADGRSAQESPMLRKWFDDGCRCFMHRCGCTTGWQPDEHCGCAPKGGA